MSQSKETFTADREREANGLPIFHAGMTKTDISIAAKSAVDAVLENGNVLEVCETVAAMEEFIKQVKADKRYTEYAREQVGRFGKLYTSPNGTKIEQAEVGTKYDFTTCGDPILELFEQKLSSAEEAVKERMEFLKRIPVGGMEIRHDDELITIYPPVKTSTSSIKITLSK